jgi:hypothetical protein
VDGCTTRYTSSGLFSVFQNLFFLQAQNITLRESLEFLVIDEADLLLSFGYENDMRGLVEYDLQLHNY